MLRRTRKSSLDKTKERLQIRVERICRKKGKIKNDNLERMLEEGRERRAQGNPEIGESSDTASTTKSLDVHTTVATTTWAYLG